MNQRNSGIAGGLQHNAVHLMNTNTSDDRHDHFSSNTNVSTTQPTFSNASAASTQLEREQSSSNTWGSLGGVTANSSVSGNSEYPNSSKFQDPIASQKKRVILQQQQRLLLLRHASKCNAGPQCSTKFCEQMVTLWKHMKTCRNKNCKTSHCLSSRCVLNHYRICKSNGRTSTCEVCGPVMLKIKQQESDDGSVEDPLTRDQDPIPLSPEQIPATIATLALCQNQPNLGDQAQLQQAQEQQSKLKALFDSLKLLQRQQEQLLEQQKILEAQAQSISDPNSAQARQLKEQQTLLQQLHKRCQQQQLLVQQELQMQAATANESEGHLFPGIEDTDVGQIIPSDKANTIVSQDSQMLRRGSGIGKRFGKALALPASLKSSGIEEPSGKKKRGSITKTERSTKKARAANKQKAILTHEKWKPEMNSAALTTKMDDEHTSLVSRMTTAEIQKHLESLNKRIILSSRTVTHKCRPIIQELIDDQFGWVFRDAVDPVALGLPDYYDVIKNPMHLDLVRKKLENAIYSDMEGFARDTRLVFENAILYNGDSSEVGELAQCMLLRFEKIYNSVVQGMFSSDIEFLSTTSMAILTRLLHTDIESSHINLESQGELCSLCGVQKRRFEPTVLYCQGKCGMQRIKRNAPYFTDRTKQNHWCDSCFAVLEPGEPIILDDGTEVLKRELQEFKNDALPEEGWVNCDECHSWVHQVRLFYDNKQKFTEPV